MINLRHPSLDNNVNYMYAKVGTCNSNRKQTIHVVGKK